MRANIELYDGEEQDYGLIKWRKGCLLYSHCGDRAWMGLTLVELLQQQVKAASEYARYPWWYSEVVGARLIKLSSDDQEFNTGVPIFQPCVEYSVAIEYLWRVFLGPEEGRYDIHCFVIAYDCEKDVIKHLEEVEWRKEVEREQRR